MLLALLGLAQPAAAQLSASASLTSDYRLRGYSLSRGEPAASASIGYDDKSGLFADGTAIVASADGGLHWIGAIGAVGYARRLDGALALDAGVLRAQFSPHARYGRATGYTEFFAGVTSRSLAAHLSISPDYLWSGVTAAYLNVEAIARPAPRWRITGHGGVLRYLGGRLPFPISRTQHDWRLALTREVGRMDVELSLTTGGPDKDYYEFTPHRKTAVAGTVRLTF